jgi:uncharacterized protein with FMN-binding domain
MKNFISLALFMALLVSLIGCGQKQQTTPPAETKTNPASDTKNNTSNQTNTQNNETNNQTNTNTNATNYKDGTYDALGDPWEYGQESAVVTIKGGKMTTIDLKRLDKAGKEVNYEEWTGQTVNNQTRPNLKQFRIDMAKKMLESQATKIDTVAGATVTTANWKIAVDRALAKAAAK